MFYRRLAPFTICIPVAIACASDEGTVAPSANDGGAGFDSAASWSDVVIEGGVEPMPDDPALPMITNASGAPSARVLDLVRSAMTGLGFDAPEGPNHDDRVYVGRRYIAWIDQTGFYGKMNGLWLLDGAVGGALDFVVKDANGRPVNVFVPGESGEGRFIGGYKGAEHVEFPNRTPEPNDDPGCATKDWCNQYALNEAPPITNPKIPWWSACNQGAPSFSTKFAPVLEEVLPNGALRLVYEGALTKEADGDGKYDGDACHADYLFPDGIRRKVFLRLGYDLFPDRNYFERTQQIVNPAGNPAFDGPMSLIGGFVMTEWPNAHYLKRFHRFWRPETRSLDLDWGPKKITLSGATWTDLRSQPALGTDVLIAWADQPISIGMTNAYALGHTATVSHVGASDNKDVGACLCVVHGAVEMGGGLIHAGISLPIAGGKTSVEGRRRLAFEGTSPMGAVTGRSFAAKTDLQHAVGRAEGDGWSAATALDAKGHMTYGPYATDWGGGAVQASFELMLDDSTFDDEVVVNLDIYDATSSQILTSRAIRRREFRTKMKFQTFALNADLDNRIGHKMELRTYWMDVSYVKVGKISVNVSSL